MRLFQNILAVIATGLLFFACNSSTEKGESVDATLSVGQVINNDFGTCDTITNQGVSIQTNLWLPADSTRAAVRARDQIIEKSIRIINSFADSASIAVNPSAKSSLQGAFEVFEKNYKDFKKTAPEAPGCWQIELKGDTVMVTSKFLFYEIGNYAFTGGAHPNTFLSYHVFDAKTGKEVQMKNFVADSTALLKLVENKFRKIENLAPDADLEEAGYFLLNHRFFMPANYVFTREGLFFYYNPYEIAAYVRGPIEFTIPYSELQGIVKKEAVF